MHIEFVFHMLPEKFPTIVFFCHLTVLIKFNADCPNHRRENREKSALDVGAYSSKARGQSEIWFWILREYSDNLYTQLGFTHRTNYNRGPVRVILLLLSFSGFYVP